MKGDPFQGLRIDSCLTLGNGLSRETHVLTLRLDWEGVTAQRAAGLGDPGGLLCPVAWGLRFYGDGVSLWVVSGQ